MSIFDGYDRALKDALEREYREADASGMKQSMDLPKGKYQGYVSATRFIANTRDYDDPHDMCDHVMLIEITVIGGQYDGCMTTKWYPVSLNGMKRLKPDLVTLGYEWKGLDVLEKQIEDGILLDWIIDFSVTEKAKNDKVYRNVWIDRNTGNQYCPISKPEGNQPGGNGSGEKRDKLPWEL